MQRRFPCRNFTYDLAGGSTMKLNQQGIRKGHRQSIILSVCDSILCIPINVLHGIYLMYIIATSDHVKSVGRQSIESLIDCFLLFFLIITNNCSQFYVNLMVSGKFRNDFGNFINRWLPSYCQIKVQGNNQLDAFNNTIERKRNVYTAPTIKFYKINNS